MRKRARKSNFGENEIAMKSVGEKRLTRFSFIGDAKKSCAGNFALRARCKLRTARNLLCKSGVEKRASRFPFIGDAKKSCALLGFFRSCLNSLNHIKLKTYF